MHQSFINFKNCRYGCCASVLSIAAIIAYWLEAPRQPPNGGTWLGYTLGTMAAVIIVFLMWFGVRKRSYNSSLGSATGWLSAHVYLGLALIVLATLHSGFQFGWNIHTYTYVLMWFVVISGCWGVYTYLRYPKLINRQRSELSREALFQKIKDLDRRAAAVAATMDAEIRFLVANATQRTMIGGGFWAQLGGFDGSRILLRSGPDRVGGQVHVANNKDQNRLIEIVAARQAASGDNEEIASLQDLLGVTADKARLLGKLRKDLQLQGLMKIWLFFHLPLSFGLLAALVSHIVTVFIYW